MITDLNLPSLNFELDLKNHSDVLHEAIFQKTCLVIGAAGTIGSNYIKSILKFSPKLIVAVDFNENNLTELTRDLRSSNFLDHHSELMTYPINLLDETFDKIFNSYSFDIVANFAAHKHVRSEKDSISVEALIKNNVFGAIKLLRMCQSSPPSHFFSVSTDKAANPVNIMGASKSLMEKLILSKQNEFRVSTARFANVAFSNGSLLDGFLYRFKKKQPLSCPSDIKRFFVTPEQSGQICLLSTFLGDSGNIFFPKLDFQKDQIYFKDLAVQFLDNNGFKPYVVDSEEEAKRFKIESNPGKYPIFFFKTDTSGEKAYEEFFTDVEDYDLNCYESLGYVKTKNIHISFKDVKNDFINVFNGLNSSKTDIVEVIQKYVPNFGHIETGKHLDQKM